ncbi:hypothetical protein OAH97_01375 [Octadecabacter sp.]|nr:hypothetical protein [Octadecabacter sp.]
MTTQIVKHKNGLTSLEFEEDDISAVRATIVDLFGNASQTKYVVASDVRFGGESFTFQNKWDDPCLISSTEQGGEYLQRIHATLKAR